MSNNHPQQDLAAEPADTDRELLARREVIRRALVVTGATTVLGSTTLFNAACAVPAGRAQAAQSTGAFTAADIAWLDEVAETILPQTDTPGAKVAEVGAFIALMVTDCMSPEEQSRFRQGMQTLEAECESNYGAGFMAATPQQRLQLLERLDRERYQVANPAGPHYFHTIKEYTVLGYFTSEIGYHQALRYRETPGRFDPCVEYDGGPLWARHA